MKTVVFLPLLLVLATGSAAAQERIDETRPARASGTVEIVNVAGKVRVTGWNRDEVRVTGTLGRGTERLDFTTEGTRTRIRVVLPRDAQDVRGSELEIRVPVQSAATVRTTSASIEISDVRGGVEARSTSGRVRVMGNPREVVATSTSGQVEVDAERLASLKAGTVSGSVRLRGSSRSVDAESVSGSLDIGVATEQARAKTVSGSLAMRGVSGNAEASTVSGSAVIEGGRFSRMALSSVSGRLRFQGDVERGGMYHLTSHSGNIEIHLPERVSADFDVTTFSGGIANAFGPEAERISRYAPGRQLHFTAGNGGARVVAKTFSGNVKLLRQ